LAHTYTYLRRERVNFLPGRAYTVVFGIGNLKPFSIFDAGFECPACGGALLGICCPWWHYRFQKFDKAITTGGDTMALTNQPTSLAKAKSKELIWQSIPI
jgi:hypothetical protein